MTTHAVRFANKVKDDLVSRWGDSSFDIKVLDKKQAHDLGYSVEALIVSEEAFIRVFKDATPDQLLADRGYEDMSLATAMLYLNPRNDRFWVENVNHYTVAVYKA